MITNKKIIKSILIFSNSSIKISAIKLQKSGLKILLVVDQKNNFLGTFVDGDLRRALLMNFDLSEPVSKVINSNPIFIDQEKSRSEVLNLMKKNKIFQIPVIEKRKVIGIYFWDNLNETEKLENHFVIMAGGQGKRLLPLTESIPKPMLEVYGKPMLQHIIEKAKAEGFYKFIISINYLGHIIKKYFGNGSKFNVEIEYIKEAKPLGTAGSLKLADLVIRKPFILTNADVLTDIKYTDLLNFHLYYHADATMAIKKFEWQNPYGVIQTNGIDLTDIKEKPIHYSYINAGIYCLNNSCIKLIKKNSAIDVTDLFKLAKRKNFKTIVYPMHENWRDIGLIDQYLELNDSINE